MDKLLLISILIVCFCKHETNSLNFPGPRVYVVTPSPRPPTGEGRAAPFYYHNWMRRMDIQQNTTTTTTPKTSSPDLIFAEFESGNKMKSIRKLLEREKVEPVKTSSTTLRPIYVPDHVSPAQTIEKNKEDTKPVDMTDYFAQYNNLYNHDNEAQVPVYMPSTTPSTTTSTTSTTTTNPISNVENIWHIIDSQKYDQYPGKWEEEPVASEDTKEMNSDTKSQAEVDNQTEDQDHDEIDENFALPGFATNPGNGAENESRAIRTEPNSRFPYVSLKPFLMKTQKKPHLNSISTNKKSNNMYTSLDNFHDVKNPVRGEAQDVIPMRQPIERYNPAQPYLPDYGSKSKQSIPSSPPTKAAANLVPPPPPPPPRISDGNFPAPSSYESFPPYAPNAPPATLPRPSPPPAKPVIMYKPPSDTSDVSGPDDDSSSDSDGPPMDLGYRYKPPSPPVQAFVPTLPPLTKPSGGYSYEKPPMSKPFTGYSYDEPQMSNDSPPENDSKPDFEGYHYSKPEAPSPTQDYPPASHSYGHDYPDLIFDKPHGGMKGGNDMNVGMVPPPPPPDTDHGPPADEHGFPQDFPGDLKFHHDFDEHDHDYHHYHHEHHTTTEMPRVNRYSYYYLGKKLYYLPLYFSVYFIVYVGALIIKAVLRHKIVYPNSWRPNTQSSTFFSKRSVDSWDLSNENLHEITGKVTHAIAVAGQKYFAQKKKK